MRGFLKQPIIWMVALEVVVVAALAGVAWHEVAGPAIGSAPPVRSALPSPGHTSVTTLPAGASTSLQPLLAPLSLDRASWLEPLSGLDRAEAQFEALEWRLIHWSIETARRYVTAVVIPWIDHALPGGPAR